DDGHDRPAGRRTPRRGPDRRGPGPSRPLLPDLRAHLRLGPAHRRLTGPEPRPFPPAAPPYDRGTRPPLRARPEAGRALRRAPRRAPWSAERSSGAGENRGTGENGKKNMPLSDSREILIR